MANGDIQSAAFDGKFLKSVWALPVVVSLSGLLTLALTNELVAAIVLSGLLGLVLSVSVRMRLYMLVALLPFAHAGIGWEAFGGFGIYDIFVLWCILLFLWRVAVIELFRIEFPSSLRFAFVMMVFFLPSVLNSISLTETAKAFAQLIVSILTAAVVYDGLMRANDSVFRVRLLKLLFFTAAIVGLIALYQTTERGGVIAVATGRAAFSLLPDPNYFSGYLLAALGLGVGVTLYERRLFPRLLLLGGLLVVVVAIIAGVSRAALVVLLLLVFGYALYLFFQPGARKLVSIVVIAGFVGLVGALLLTDVGSRVVDLFTLSRRIEAVVAGRDASLQQRQTITGVTLKIVDANFISGVGFGAFEKTFDKYRGGHFSTFPTGSAHNTFLRILAETGIIGFVPFVIFVGLVMRSLWQAFRRERAEGDRVLMVGVLFSISTFWLMSLTLDQLFQPHFWVVYGIGLYMVWASQHSAPSLDIPALSGNAHEGRRTESEGLV